MDIVIYTNPRDLKHKQGKGKGAGWFYWKFGRFPKKVEPFDRVYFAIKGFVVGFFISEIPNENEIEWHSNSWHSLKKKIPTKPFRGFRYKWW